MWYNTILTTHDVVKYKGEGELRTNLKMARTHKGKTQQDVANYLNISKNQYQRIEYGESGTVEESWLKLFEYFGRETPLHELMEKTERKKI